MPSPQPEPKPAPGAAADPATAFLARSARRVEDALERWLPREGEGAPRLAQAMRYSVLAGGKRLRPALALAAAEAVGGDSADALPFACAVELVHTYSLVHDDLPAMDDDDLRRGRATNHVVFGEAVAILAGDALLTFAFELLLDRTRDGEVARRLGRTLAGAAGFSGMVGGQVEDLAAEAEPPDLDRVQRIHERKTAALIRAAAVGGGIAAGAGDAAVEALGAYGAHLGLAFQIVDDVLDETAGADALGKTPGKDRQSDKLTWVRVEGLEAARRRAGQHAEAAVAALAALPSADVLRDLAEFVVGRDR